MRHFSFRFHALYYIFNLRRIVNFYIYFVMQYLVGEQTNFYTMEHYRNMNNSQLSLFLIAVVTFTLLDIESDRIF